jgi:hypothetical protein
MKPIDLTEEQKNKLLEMCQVLFPEYKKIFFFNKDQEGNYDEEDFISFDSEYIHWFEFCTRFLMSKLDALYIEKILDPVDPYGKTNNYGRGSIKDYPDNWSELWNKRIFYEYPNNLNGTFPKKHPVDYLYDEFKKNK